MKQGLTIALAAGMFFCAIAAYAHHSFAATYNESKTIQIEGKLLQFMYRNPHSFVSIEAPDESGVVQRWDIEWGGAGQLGNQGVTRETLKVGDILNVTGNPGRNAADHRMRMLSLRRKSDGFAWGKLPSEVVD
jgi:hypothetical protein